MSDFVKLYDGKIVKSAEIDPEAEFVYTDATEYEKDLLKQIADLEGIIAKFSDGSDQAQMIEVGNFPQDVIDTIEKHNSDIGYTGAVNELTELNELLECLRNG